MADSRSHTKSQSLHQQNKSNVNSQVTHILFKSLVFLLFLIAIPLFPSQAPEFISHKFLTKFWEIFHLLFIGLAVCYGLFSRRNADLEFESAQLNNSFDDSQSSNFVSRIFHVTPIFEDGSDEKNVYPNWNSHLVDSRFTAPVDNDRSKIDKDEQIRVFQGSENRREILLEQDENSVVQTWSSQYFHGEPEVVVSQVNDQWGRPQIRAGFQPLGLPVRSLNSQVRNLGSCNQFSNGIQSDSSLIGSLNCSMDEGPVNLEEKLNDDSFSPSENQRHARSGRSEQRERVVPVSNRSQNKHDEPQFEPFKSESFWSSNGSSQSDSNFIGSPNLEEKLNENGFFPWQQWLPISGRPELKERLVPSHVRPFSVDETQLESFKSQSFRSNASHIRPFSVDETQLESFKSQSFRSNASLSSQTSSMSTSPDLSSPSRSSPSDSPNSGTEDSPKMKESESTLSPQSPEAVKHREAPLNAFHLRKYSSGSLFQKKRVKDDSKSSSHKRREAEQGSLKPDKKLANIDKDSSKGKSVRTIRSGAHTLEAKKASKTRMEDNVGKGYNVDVVKIEVLTGFNKKNADSHCKVPKPAFAEYQISEKKEALESDVGKNRVLSSFIKNNADSHQKIPKPTFTEKMESEQESESEIDNFQVRMDNGASISLTSNSGNDPDEVDKKAGEFIAKFREQIRLQKVASAERSKGLRMSGKYLR